METKRKKKLQWTIKVAIFKSYDVKNSENESEY